MSTVQERASTTFFSSKTISSVELFTGGGGLAIGFEQAGFRHELLVEKNRHANATIRANVVRNPDRYGHWSLYDGDVHSFAFSDSCPPIHLVTGGPPCQPFSVGGRHKGNADHRDLFPEAVRAVRELQPRAFVFENVRGLLRHKFATYFEYVILQLTYPELVRGPDESTQDHLARLERRQTSRVSGDLSYRVVYRLLNAADYGVPQKRDRVFIVGFRSDLNTEWSFPVPTHDHDRLLWEKWVTGEYWKRHAISTRDRPEPTKSELDRIPALTRLDFGNESEPWRTVRDAIFDLPDPKEHIETEGVLNHVLRPGAKPYPGHTGSPLDEPAKTLKAGDHGVPGGENMLRRADGSVRYFTVRESARLQTFPDDYEFSGSWSEAMRQIGNAVPVTLARTVADSVRVQLQGEHI